MARKRSKYTRENLPTAPPATTKGSATIHPQSDSLWDKPGVAEYVEGFWAAPGEMALREAVAAWIGKGDGDNKLLDVGCGGAHIAPMLKGWNYRGVDNSYDLLRMAAERTRAANLVVHDLSEPLPFQDDEFDVVLCMNVLRHLDSYEHVVAEMARVTRLYVYIVDLFQGDGKHTYGTSQVAGQEFTNNIWALPVFLADAARITGWLVKRRAISGLAGPVTGVRMEPR